MRYLINGYIDVRTQKVVEAQSEGQKIQSRETNQHTQFFNLSLRPVPTGVKDTWRCGLGTGYIPQCLPFEENQLGSCVVLITRCAADKEVRSATCFQRS